MCGYDARKGKAALRSLIEFDEGSSYLGEVALVPQDSAIARCGLLFYNTLLMKMPPVIWLLVIHIRLAWKAV